LECIGLGLAKYTHFVSKRQAAFQQLDLRDTALRFRN
jgi:hypothetical protein